MKKRERDKVAIEFARLEYVSRSSGGNSCRKAAYNGRQKVRCEREGTTFDFSHEGDSSHHEILIPKGVSEKFKNAESLWNAVEHSESRINSQLAKELVLALPDDPQIQLEDRIALTKTFIQKQFVDKGLAAQVDIHQPHREKDHNWHAHILITTRRFTPDGMDLGEKARDLDAQVRKGKVIEGEKWGKLWKDHQNAYFKEKGIELRVDPTGIISQEHLGPVRMRARAFAMLNEHAQIEQANAELSVRPDQILKKLTEKQSFFSKEDVEQFITKHVPTDAVSATKNVFWAQPNLLQLLDPNSGNRIDQYTSAEVREEENRILRLSERIYYRKALKVSRSAQQDILEKWQLNEEQEAAFKSLMQGRQLGLIEGRAGTGKSYLIGALRETYQALGYEVRGLGPTSEVAQDLQKSGFSKAENIHRFLFRHKNGREKVGNQEVWIVDEAAMIGNSALMELFKIGWKRNCQLIMVGDSRQLPSVERGGMFEVFCQRYGTNHLEAIRRQVSQEDREIASLASRGDISASIDKLQQNGQIHWTATKQEAIERLVTKWNADQLTNPGQTSLILEHRNYFARMLNDTIHSHRLNTGEVGPEEFQCETFLGTAYISQGDRLQFRKNNRELNVSNGLLGSITSIEEDKIVVRLDSGEERKFNPKQFHHFQLGYAGTIHRSQGKTVDRAYTLHSPWINRNLYYVATTRHRQNLDYFVSKEDCSSLAELKYQALRKGTKETTLRYAVKGEALNYTSESELPSWKRALSKLGDFIHRNTDFYQVEHSNEKPLYRVERVESNPDSPLIQDKQVREEQQPGLEGYEAIITEYFDANEVVRHHTRLKKAEVQDKGGISPNHAIYKNWQQSLNSRDEVAHRLSQKVPKSYQERALEPNSLAKITSQAERYSRFLEGKIQASKGNETRETLKYLNTHVEELCYRLFPEGPTHRNSHSWRFRANHSLSIPVAGEKIGSYFDFVEGEGGSLLGLIQKELNLELEEACRWALDLPHTSLTTTSREPPPIKEEKWVSLAPVNENPTISQKQGLLKHYQETVRYSYRGRNGELLYYILRLEAKDQPGKKITPPLSYGHYVGDPERPFWRFKAYQQDKRSLYNLHLLDRDPSAVVLLVEGEKAAEAASGLFPNLVVMTWPGGAGAVTKADWSVLQDKRVVVWPDHDEPGFKAAEGISKELRRVGVKELKSIARNQLQKFPEKWDLADAIPQGMDRRHLERMIKEAEPHDRGPIALYEKLYPKEVRSQELRSQFLYRIAFLEKVKGISYREKNGLDDPVHKAFVEFQDRESTVRKYVQQTLGVRGELLESVTSISNAFTSSRDRLPIKQEMEEMIATARKLEEIPSSSHEKFGKAHSQEIEERYFTFAEYHRKETGPLMNLPDFQAETPKKDLTLSEQRAPTLELER